MLSGAGECYDFFLSRRDSVATIAREVTNVLMEKGYTLRVEDYDFELSASHRRHALPFEPSVPEIRQFAHQLARRARHLVSRTRRNCFGRPLGPYCLWGPQTRSWRGHRN